MTVTLKQLSDTSWILQKNGDRFSLLFATPSGTITALGGLEKKQFANFDELSDYLGEKIELEQNEEIVEELGNVGGYPVKHSNIVEVSGHDLPVYKRGNTEHCAGFYGVKFKHGWTQSYCPKFTTLTENEFIGPFRTKLEMLSSISQKKRAIEI